MRIRRGPQRETIVTRAYPVYGQGPLAATMERTVLRELTLSDCLIVGLVEVVGLEYVHGSHLSPPSLSTISPRTPMHPEGCLPTGGHAKLHVDGQIFARRRTPKLHGTVGNLEI